MAVLKFKDDQGNWHSIPAIQGASAYEQAVDGGYQGTLEDFYLALNEVNAAVQAAGDAEDSASAAAASALQLAAGVASPAGTYATTAALASVNPDHSKIYVVTADGHWYYWSGSAWADGGVYQAVSVTNEIASLTEMDDKLRLGLIHLNEDRKRVRNLVVNGNFPDEDTTWVTYDGRVTISIADNELTATCLPGKRVFVGQSNQPIWASNMSHKYYICFDIAASKNATGIVKLCGSTVVSSASESISLSVTTTKTRKSLIITGSSSVLPRGLYFDFATLNQAGDWIKVSNVNAIDLTIIYGGNIPTIEELDNSFFWLKGDFFSGKEYYIAKGAVTQTDGSKLELTNYIVNGGFSYGVNSWETYAGRSTLTAENNEMTVTTNAGQHIFVSQTNSLVYGASTDTYYIRFEVSANKVETGVFCLTLSNITASASALIPINFTTEKTVISKLVSATSVPQGIYFRSETMTTTGDWIKLSNIVILNATDLYGALPQIEEIDALFDAMDTPYFDFTAFVDIPGFVQKPLNDESDYIIVQNLAPNGKPELNADYWVSHLERSTVAYDNGDILATSQTEMYFGQNGNFSIPTGHKVYVSFMAQGSVNDTLQPQFGALNFSTVGGNTTFNITTEMNQYKGIITISGAQLNAVSIRFAGGSGLDEPNAWVRMRNLMIVDLTATYGAGNEPNSTQFYELLNNNGRNDFFENKVALTIGAQVIQSEQIPFNDIHRLFTGTTLEEVVKELHDWMESYEPPSAGFAIDISAITNTENGLASDRNLYPVLWGIKKSNKRDWKEPETLGWLYYHPYSTPYTILYASGKPDNLKVIGTWDATKTETGSLHPSYYQPMFLPNGDILMILRGSIYQTGGGRGNPILYPANDFSNPVVVDFGLSTKPTAPFNNVGYEYIDSQNCLLFSEYTRPVHTNSYAWKVTMPVTNPSNWTITKTFTVVGGSGSTIDEVKHIHVLNYDPFSKRCYMGTGDWGSSPCIYESVNYGSSWTLVLGPNEGYCRTLGWIFTETHGYWASDSPTAAHYLMRVSRDESGILDFTDITILYTLPAAQATYGISRVYNPEGILLLDRYDGSSTVPIKIHFWSFEKEQMYIVAELPPIDPDVGDALGFRCDAQQMYQALNDNRHVFGFYSVNNCNGVLGNSSSDRVYNLALTVKAIT